VTSRWWPLIVKFMKTPFAGGEETGTRNAKRKASVDQEVEAETRR